MSDAVSGVSEIPTRSLHHLGLVALPAQINGYYRPVERSKLTSPVVLSAARPLRYMLPTFLDTPVNITAYRGTDTELPCAVHNLESKMIVWKKLSQVHPIAIGEYVYDPDSSFEVKKRNLNWNLRINDVQMRHAGIYECQISTKEDFTRNVSLTVIDDGTQRRPGEAGIRLDGSEYVEKGSSIVLNCTATAIDYRPKGVDWFKDGSKIKSDMHVLISEASSNNVFYSTLEISRSTMDDAGTYVCRSSKFNVASTKVIVLNTGSSKSERNTNVSDPNDPRGPDKVKQRSGSRSCHTALAPSSVLLLYALLCWPLLRAAVGHLSGQ
ncbi:hypothetical protein BaRGS_00027144 [Batillaria attramentaria]|uniref:Ig-like domain-containing protein n=1 Tax=Batillaria attramentaria TaxID=370345 RepID=A0ABD0K3V0_9CAEN